VLDESGSIGEDNFDLMTSFVSQLVARMDIDSGNTRVGAITFSNNVRQSFDLDEHSTVDDVQNAFSQFTFLGGNTRTDQALEHVRLNMLTAAAGDRSDAPNVVVVFTDGKSTQHDQTSVSTTYYIASAVSHYATGNPLAILL